MDCSLCCEPFEEDGHCAPRTLHCGHTFCTHCIGMLERTQPRFSARCPECRAFIRFHRIPPVSFPKNFKLLEVIRERKGPPPKTAGADTTATYNDHRGNDATDPSGFLPRGPEAHEATSPPNPLAEESSPWIHFGWTPRLAVDTDDNQHTRGWIRGSLRQSQLAPQNQLDPVAEVVPPQRPPSTLFLGALRGHLSRPPVPVPPTPEATTTASTTPDEGSSSNDADVWHANGSAGLAGLASSGEQNPVARGRAVEGANGGLVCKFFQEGTCQYGPFCWFNHPCINPSKPLCKHWLQGRCRMGLGCNYRHGVPHAQQRRRQRAVQRSRRPGDPGPSRDAQAAGEGQPGPSPADGGLPGGNQAMERRGAGERSVVLVDGQGVVVGHRQRLVNSALGHGERTIHGGGREQGSDEGFYDRFGSVSSHSRHGTGHGNSEQ